MPKDGDIFLIVLIIFVMIFASRGSFFNLSSNATTTPSAKFSYTSGTKGTVNSNTNNPPAINADIRAQLREATKKANYIQSEISALQKANYEKANASPYKNKVYISSVYPNNDPVKEYLILNSASSEKIPLTGWKLKGTSSGAEAIIGSGTYLFYYGTQEPEEPIYLSLGDKVIISTGRSPLLGRNFKINKCSGFLDQYRNFLPTLSHSCPLPKDEKNIPIPSDDTTNTYWDRACWNLIEKLPSCRVITDKLDKKLYNQTCRDYIANSINMNTCINNHYYDSNFEKNEWRVFLARSVRMWKDKNHGRVENYETVQLLDSNNKVVDEYKYRTN